MKSTAPHTWRDVAITVHEIELLKRMAGMFLLGGEAQFTETLRQIIARWEANDATEFTA